MSQRGQKGYYAVPDNGRNKNEMTKNVSLTSIRNIKQIDQT